MFKTNAPDSVGNAYVDIDEGLGTPGTRLTAEDRNVIQDELVNVVESSAQVIDVAGGAKSSQVARAMTILGASAMSCVDTGAADAYVVNPLGASIVKPSAFSEIGGLIAGFVPLNPNTGPATVNYAGLGVKNIVKIGGGALLGDEFTGYVLIRYDLGNDRWEAIQDASTKYDSGDVLLWAGTVANIPGYKHICDGTNGTPDLTDRFVIHADADAAGTHNVGDTIDGSGATDGHQLVESEIPSHTHGSQQINAGTGVAAGTEFEFPISPTTATGGDGSHDHDITDYKPRSYALAYVMVL